MGMFDSVMVACPDCHNPVEFQSKSGDCTLQTYCLEDAPDRVLDGIYGDIEHCSECRTTFGVELSRPIRPQPRTYIATVVRK